MSPRTSDTPTARNTPSKKHIGKIVVDRELCIGAASCIALAGKTFRLDDENKAVIIEPRSDSDDDIHAAAASCPTNAIYLYDEDGNQVYPPK